MMQRIVELERPCNFGAAVVIGIAVAIFVAVFVGLMGPAPARDLDGRWAQSPNREWFNQLRNSRGNRCCDDNDGRRVNDPDWELTKDNESGYRVRLKPGGDWVDVPPETVVTENNKVGFAMVWPVMDEQGQPTGVMCFMPGSST